MELLSGFLRLYVWYCAIMLILGSVVGLGLWVAHCIARRRDGRRSTG